MIAKELRIQKSECTFVGGLNPNILRKRYHIDSKELDPQLTT
jgi:hypothetical protein